MPSPVIPSPVMPPPIVPAPPLSDFPFWAEAIELNDNKATITARPVIEHFMVRSFLHSVYQLLSRQYKTAPPNAGSPPRSPEAERSTAGTAPTRFRSTARAASWQRTPT